MKKIRLPVTVGEILAYELEARGMTQRDLAFRMGRPYQTVNEIIHNKKRLSALTAIQLGNVLDTSAEFWWNIENNYTLAVARRKLWR